MRSVVRALLCLRLNYRSVTEGLLRLRLNSLFRNRTHSFLRDCTYSLLWLIANAFLGLGANELLWRRLVNLFGASNNFSGVGRLYGCLFAGRRVAVATVRAFAEFAAVGSLICRLLGLLCL
uniref:Putative transmembrane protein n=1 Tax=Toxoplasma gondii COUG TaxID=1074873 RepID=A0A2G8Y2E8_TOXGO|nr:putative transmembrane protein [Toxoplasma gondii COUG]